MIHDNIRRVGNNSILHLITEWSWDPGDTGSYFQLKRDTPVVIAPGSDMPYCLVRWYPSTASLTGWPAQAANPAAYVSTIKTLQADDDIYGASVVNGPILLSNVPVILKPGYYVPAIPQMAYVGVQWDYNHAWPTDAFKEPRVHLMESDHIVAINPYSFTTEELASNQSNLNIYTPWLITPQDAGLIATDDSNDAPYSKLLGCGSTNASGNDPSGANAPKFWFHCKNNTYQDTAASLNKQQNMSMVVPDSGDCDNEVIERLQWFCVRLQLLTGNPEASVPEGIAIVIK